MRETEPSSALEKVIEFFRDSITADALKFGVRQSQIAQAFLTDAENMYPVTREGRLQLNLMGIEVIRRTGFARFAFGENFQEDEADRHLITGMARLGLAYALLFEADNFEENLSTVMEHVATAKKDLWMHYYNEEGRPRAVYDAFKSFVDLLADSKK